MQIINYKNYFDFESYDFNWSHPLCVSSKNIFFNRQLHLELSRLTRELNLIFTVQMTVEMTSHFLYITSLLYYLYWMLIQKQREKLFTIYIIYDWLSIILWVSTFFVRLYITNYICENVIVKVKSIIKLRFI